MLTYIQQVKPLTQPLFILQTTLCRPLCAMGRMLLRRTEWTTGCYDLRHPSQGVLL
jgi:hypothetical protein